MVDNINFPLVTVCFITYNRIDILRKSFYLFLNRCTYPRERLELILCDDCSPSCVQTELRKMPFDKHIISNKNTGLGNNTNNGIRAASGEYILQLQDDWLTPIKGDFIESSIELMAKNPDVMMVRFDYAPDTIPSDIEFYEKNKYKDGEFLILKSNKSKILLSQRYSPYSDWPHIKNRDFHNTLGLYKENVPMTTMELDFVERFSSQNIVKIGYISNIYYFEDIGMYNSWNPSKKRDQLKKTLLENYFTRYPLKIFLLIKHKLYRKLIKLYSRL